MEIKFRKIGPNLIPAAITAMLFSPCVLALPPCANSAQNGGLSGFPVKVDISPSDLNNNAEGAWIKIAEAAQAQYGPSGNISQSAGIVQMTVVGSTWLSGPMPIGNFPIDFNGNASIGQSILMMRGLDDARPDLMEDMACDPKKNDGNDCCEECSSGYCFLGPLDIFNSGFIQTNRKAIVRNESIGVVSVRKKMLAA